jgi:hypothetical protein
MQAGVSVTAWVFGHQIFDMVGLMLHPLLFFAWIYVLTLTSVPAWSYFTTLVVVGFYTSGLGYLVRVEGMDEGQQPRVTCCWGCATCSSRLGHQQLRSSSAQQPPWQCAWHTR